MGAYQIRKVFLLRYLSELRLIRVSGVGKQLLELEMTPRTAPRSYKSNSLVKLEEWKRTAAHERLLPTRVLK